MKDHVEIGHLIKYDTFTVHTDQYGSKYIQTFFIYAWLHTLITILTQLLRLRTKKLVHILTLFVIFRVQYAEFHHLLYTKAYTTWITYNVVRTYLQYNTITYDTNNTNAYMIPHVAYND